MRGIEHNPARVPEAQGELRERLLRLPHEAQQQQPDRGWHGEPWMLARLWAPKER